MKKILSLMLTTVILATMLPAIALAGDCKARTNVNWHATISSAVHVRSDCPTGDVVGTASAGEVVRILEVDRFNEFYLIESVAGTGFVFSSFLSNINQTPLPGTETYTDSIFPDLNPAHKYYEEIEDVAARGIVSGTPEGLILADDLIKRAELAKILVEATTDDDTIAVAVLPPGFYADAEQNAWYSKYLKVAYDKGIMRGDIKKSITVRPGDGANGAEVAKMIAEAFELEIPEQEAGEFWYVRYMDLLKSMGALPFSNPTHQVTRAEMMFVVSKVLAAKAS